MKIEVNFSRKQMFFFSLIFTFLFGSILVYAYNPTNNPEAEPSVFGHTLNELSSVQGLNCASGQALTRVNNVWSCAQIQSGSATLPSGFIIMSLTGCPNGYGRVKELDGKFPRGASTYDGTTGGSETHKHVAAAYITTIYTSHPLGGWDAYTPSGSLDPLLEANHLPPYLNVVWCKKI